MSNKTAIFIDVDNIVIGAQEAKVPFEIPLILEYLREHFDAKVVLRWAYGDWRQNQSIPRQLATTGFELKSVVRINQTDKNLADIQMVVDAAETLLDEDYAYQTYVLVTGDRDFIPLVQLLQRCDRTVIGLGLRHTTSQSLANLCDIFIYYDDLISTQIEEKEDKMIEWIQKAAEMAFKNRERVQASVFRDLLQKASGDEFGALYSGRNNLSKILENYPQFISLNREETTLFICPPGEIVSDSRDLRSKYRSSLKKRGIRVVNAPIRLMVLRDVVDQLGQADSLRWNTLLDQLDAHYTGSGENLSRSLINDVLRVGRRGGVITTPPRSQKQPLTSLQLSLSVNGERAFQDAVMLCDKVYLQELYALYEGELDMHEVSFALYDSAERITYLTHLLEDLAPIIDDDIPVT